MANNPLLKALKTSEGPMAPKESSMRMAIPMPRMMEFDMSEIEPASKPGDQVTAYVYGTIKSINDEGKAMVNISKVESNDTETQDDSSTGSNIVTTQESHVP